MKFEKNLTRLGITASTRCFFIDLVSKGLVRRRRYKNTKTDDGFGEKKEKLGAAS